MLIHTRVPATIPNALQNAAANARNELGKGARVIMMQVCPIEVAGAHSVQRTEFQRRRNGHFARALQERVPHVTLGRTARLAVCGETPDPHATAPRRLAVGWAN